MKLEDIEELDHKLCAAKDIRTRMRFLEDKIAEFYKRADDSHTVLIDITRSEPSFSMQYMYADNNEFLNECVLNMFRYSLRTLQKQLEEL